MDEIFDAFQAAHTKQIGPLLASCFVPAANIPLSTTGTPPQTTYPRSHFGRLYDIRRSTTPLHVNKDVRAALTYRSRLALPKSEINVWIDALVAYFRCINDLVEAEEKQTQPRNFSAREIEGQWSRVYEGWKEVVNALYRGYSSAGFKAWTTPVLYVATDWLTTFAIRTDEAGQRSREEGGGREDFEARHMALGEEVMAGDGEGEENKTLEDAARQINRIFSLCISDRSPIEESRKWALYYITNRLFKTYFKLNSLPLTKTILRSLLAQQSSDLPPLDAFPKSHTVPHNYYHGLISFLSEDYTTAETHLTTAFHSLPRIPEGKSRRFSSISPETAAAATKNRNLILSYLVPARFITSPTTLPTDKLFPPASPLRPLFSPLIRAIRRGNVAAFDAALENGFAVMVRRRIYLTCERARDLCVRNLFRRIAMSGELGEGVRVRTRLEVDELWAGLRLSLGGRLGKGRVEGSAGGTVEAEMMDKDEAECIVANLIYRGLMKGYISRERSMVVLSKRGDAFPGTGV